MPHDMVLPRDLKFTSILSLFNDSRKMETFLYNNCKPCLDIDFIFVENLMFGFSNPKNMYLVRRNLFVQYDFPRQILGMD